MFGRVVSLQVLLMLGFSGVGLGQNLVPNPGFEQSIGLPDGLGQWPLCQGWSNGGSPAANPDYYHMSGSGAGDLPVTPAAIINPHGGMAVMGFVAFHKLQPNIRQYLSVQLSAPMIPGEKYEISFYITNGQVTELSNAGLGVAHLGVSLSETPHSQVGTLPISVTPDAEYMQVLYDRQWKRLSFYVTADASHEFLTIGLFRDDTDVVWEVHETGHPMIAYYFVDDFTVRHVTNWTTEMNGNVSAVKGPKGSDLVEEEPEVHSGRPVSAEPFYIPNAFSPDGDGVNDEFRPIFNTDCEGYEFRIFDRWGHLVFMTDRTDRAWNGHINGKPVEPGVYVWQISYFGKGLGDSEESKVHRGSVQVLR